METEGVLIAGEVSRAVAIWYAQSEEMVRGDTR